MVEYRGIDHSLSEDQNTLTIRVNGAFGFQATVDFRECYKSAPSGVSFVIDMGQAQLVRYMTVHAFFLLRKHVGPEVDIAVMNCPPEIQGFLLRDRFRMEVMESR